MPVSDSERSPDGGQLQRPEAPPKAGRPPEGPLPEAPPKAGRPPREAAPEEGSGVQPTRPPIGVNTRISDASNAKQARIREAEEDRVLIARAQQGDMAAFRRLVERHQRR